MPAHPSDIVTYWRNAGPTKWFAHAPAFDEAIRLKFEPVHFAAARGQYDRWASEPEGALALVLLLDQFPRNLFRGGGHAFATDPLARAFASKAIDDGFDREVDPALRRFFYLPFTHSEDPADQARAMVLFQTLAEDTGDRDSLKWAALHRDIIARFGRFPHRNKALGRATTVAEKLFLDEGEFAG